MTEWQPIELAPKHEAVIVLLQDDTVRVAIRDAGWAWGWRSDCYAVNPKAWVPYPSVPAWLIDRKGAPAS